ncbi:hypothetical protein [Oceanobacillus halophilus]|uniref:Uncharacterized protein n=1 Tax=Oceanobacillus halophilus TaxID=930130 RepID=A0A495A701_9BACI|nr:hypothetical protein [Oceanobacillus halophilus]RKQ35607.1 hypothetical protein D8M06_04880 [Oceanobacillus halophilus]
MKKKKRKANTPKHKRLKRNGRLQAAVHWIPKYEGKNLVKGYSKHFGVNKLCAVKELEMLGYSIKESYKKELRDAEQQKQIQAEKRKKSKQQNTEWDLDSDETFAFIAGYTSGGAPYGITWEELEKDLNRESNTKDKDKVPSDIEHEDLPS